MRRSDAPEKRSLAVVYFEKTRSTGSLFQR